MKKFNLEEAKAGKPVVNGCGYDVEILKFGRKCFKPIIAIVLNDAAGTLNSYTEEGMISIECRTPKYDLFMKSEKKERTGWINIYSDDEHRCPSNYIYDSEEKAKRSGKCIATVEIKWEE